MIRRVKPANSDNSPINANSGNELAVLGRASATCVAGWGCRGCCWRSLDYCSDWNFFASWLDRRNRHGSQSFNRHYFHYLDWHRKDRFLYDLCQLDRPFLWVNEFLARNCLPG